LNINEHEYLFKNHVKKTDCYVYRCKYRSTCPTTYIYLPRELFADSIQLTMTNTSFKSKGTHQCESIKFKIITAITINDEEGQNKIITQEVHNNIDKPRTFIIKNLKAKKINCSDHKIKKMLQVLRDDKYPNNNELLLFEKCKTDCR
jgi:hypothetical protein